MLQVKMDPGVRPLLSGENGGTDAKALEWRGTAASGRSGDSSLAEPLLVIPANAGIQFDLAVSARLESRIKMDSGVRRNDDFAFSEQLEFPRTAVGVRRDDEQSALFAPRPRYAIAF